MQHCLLSCAKTQCQTPPTPKELSSAAVVEVTTR